MTYDQNDVQSLALVAWKEARGQGVVGCHYVMHVVCNRVGKPGFAATLHDVIYGRNQFTSMSVPSDPEFNLNPLSTSGVTLSIYQTCLVDAPAVLDGSEADPTNGALWYANELNIQPGGWYFRNIISEPNFHPIVARFGQHTFRK